MVVNGGTGRSSGQVAAIVLVVIVLLAAAVALWLQPGGKRPPNVVLITVESLRTDHVGFLDGQRETTPHLDALAAEAMVYANAWSVTSWTLTSHASLFTGLYPSAHRAIAPLDRLGDSYRTLAESFAAGGYETAAVVSGPYLRRQHGLDQGFERYDDEPSSAEDVQAHDDVTNVAMLDKLRRFLVTDRDPERPFFLFAYFWDPHYDYLPPAPFDRMFADDQVPPVDVRGFGTTDRIHAESPPAVLEWVRAQYDGEIAWTDHTLDRLFDTLRAEGLWEDTIVVVTSDHGEEFFDHGKKGHKNNLFVESVHVPLIVKYAGAGPIGRDDRPVSLVDLYPTLIAEAGLEPSRRELPLHGRSLRDPDPDPDRPIYFELLSTWYYPEPDGVVGVRRQEWLGVLQGGRHLVGVPGKRMWLFDLEADPREQSDLFRHGDRHEPLARRLDGQLRRYASEMAATRAFFEAGAAAEVDDEQLERLRSLGYVQ